MNQTDAMARAARAKKVTWVGFWVNVVLSVAKIIAGIVGRSGAMIADGVHSISDFVTDIIVIVFIGVSAKGENTRFRSLRIAPGASAQQQCCQQYSRQQGCGPFLFHWFPPLFPAAALRQKSYHKL